MSAIPASAAVGAKTPAGRGVQSAAPTASKPGTRKRSVATPNPHADAASSDSPAARASERLRHRDAAATSANGDAGADAALLSHPKDLHVDLHIGDDDGAGQQHQSKHKTVALTNNRGSPLKKKTVKYKEAQYKEAHITVRRRQSSFWDLTGFLFSRFFLIFVIGAGLGSTWWTWRMRSQVPISSELLSTEVEKLEEYVSKTTKWMQVQLEALDMKIGQEVGALKKEVAKELVLQETEIATEVRNLRDRVENVGAAVEDLYKQGGLLTKKEALLLIKEVVNQRAAEGKGKALSLDDVRTAARQVVLRELERHSADGIGRVDYALGSGGGRVISHSEGFYPGKGPDWRNILGLLPGSSRLHPLADKVLQPSFGEPGQCLPLKGSEVWVDIALRTTIHPDAITLEHVTKDNAYDVSSAPKDFRLLGWREPRGPGEGIQVPRTMKKLGEFTYDTQKASVQTFSLSDEAVAGELINMIRVHILSNQGSPTHTCIYRVRMHGSNPALRVAPNFRESDS